MKQKVLSAYMYGRVLPTDLNLKAISNNIFLKNPLKLYLNNHVYMYLNMGELA